MRKSNRGIIKATSRDKKMIINQKRKDHWWSIRWKFRAYWQIEAKYFKTILWTSDNWDNWNFRDSSSDPSAPWSSRYLYFLFQRQPVKTTLPRTTRPQPFCHKFIFWSKKTTSSNSRYTWFHMHRKTIFTSNSNPMRRIKKNSSSRAKFSKSKSKDSTNTAIGSIIVELS